jgi:hypothetical protein
MARGGFSSARALNSENNFREKEEAPGFSDREPFFVKKLQL